MKVLVLEFHQESNSFCPVTSTMEDYLRCSVLEGEGFREGVRDQALAPNGMFDVLEQAGAEIIPGYGMRSPAGGTVEHSVFVHFLEKMHGLLDRHLPLDGILVSLHGATQTTQEDDACGVILEQLRARAGEDTVIAASLDLHANVTQKMHRCADFLCGYLTYPHVDVYETGVRAATLAVNAMRGGKQMHMARACVPMIAPACGYTTNSQPLLAVVEKAKALVSQGILADYSIFHMQPWLDVKEGCGVVLAIGEDAAAAARHSEDLAREVFALRKQMQPKLETVDEVIRLAEKNDSGKPIIVVDFADSTNAGAAGDSAYVLERILALDSPVRAAHILIDRPAVDAAFAAGVGAELDITLGGTRGAEMARPVAVHARVRSLHDGAFILEGPSMRGVPANVGKTALLTVGNVDVVVCYAMASTGDPQLYRHFGVEPTLYQMVTVKANTSYRAAYEIIAEKICVVDTQGAATADLTSLPFRRLPKSMYPFDVDAEFVENCVTVRPVVTH